MSSGLSPPRPCHHHTSFNLPPLPLVYITFIYFLNLHPKIVCNSFALYPFLPFIWSHFWARAIAQQQPPVRDDVCVCVDVCAHRVCLRASIFRTLCTEHRSNHTTAPPLRTFHPSAPSLSLPLAVIPVTSPLAPLRHRRPCLLISLPRLRKQRSRCVVHQGETPT